MIFQRLIWSALATAVIVGSVQTGVQRWQAAPLILAAEVYEDQKAEAETAAPAMSTAAEPAAAPAPAHEHGAAAAESHEHEHDHGAGAAKEWEPANGFERIGWTWVANILHALSMALLVFAVMGIWLAKRGKAPLALAGWVAAAGFLSFHLWPTLGLPAEVPGMEAAPLHARQLWWVLAVGCAALACAVAGFSRVRWHWLAVPALLALPFVVGAPQLQGDAIVGYGPEAHAALESLGQQFIWATTWVALSFWLSMGVVAGWVFARWLRPALLAALGQSGHATTGSLGTAP